MPECRLAAFYTEKSSHLDRIFTALKEASRHDEYAVTLPSPFSSHGDGWGYAGVSLGRGESLAVYKTTAPIWEGEAPAMPPPLVAILHARKASSHTPVNLPAAHPYLVAASDGTLLAVAQNGGVSRSGLAGLLDSLGAPHPKPESVSDSHLYAYLIAHLYSGDTRSLAEILEEAYLLVERRGLKHRCLNTMALALTPRGEVELAATRHIKTVNKAVLDYCELFTVEAEGLRAVVSSTVARHLAEYNPVALGENRALSVYP